MLRMKVLCGCLRQKYQHHWSKNLNKIWQKMRLKSYRFEGQYTCTFMQIYRNLHRKSKSMMKRGKKYALIQVYIVCVHYVALVKMIRFLCNATLKRTKENPDNEQQVHTCIWKSWHFLFYKLLHTWSVVANYSYNVLVQEKVETFGISMQQLKQAVWRNNSTTYEAAKKPNKNDSFT